MTINIATDDARAKARHFSFFLFLFPYSILQATFFGSLSEMASLWLSPYRGFLLFPGYRIIAEYICNTFLFSIHNLVIIVFVSQLDL